MIKRTLLGIALGALLCVTVASAQTIQVDRNNRTIAVTASDKASAEADTAIVTVGFQIYAPDASTAYSQGSQHSNAILDALKKAGVADKAIESQDQKLNYTEFPSDDKTTPEQRAQKQFTLQQSWRVTCVAADAAKVLHVAVEAGATFGWWRYVGSQGRVLGIDHFGASGKASDVFPHFGFTADNVIRQVEELLKS